MKLFLKGMRCDTPKCAFERREVPPGQQHQRRGKLTDYGVHLREKQKVKHYYGVLERQFRRYFGKAERSRGNTGSALMVLLERRLDNTVYRLGFGSSRPQARQLVSHGHVRVNDRKVDIPSFEVKVGDVITLSQKAAKNGFVLEAVEAVKGRGMPRWLELEAENMTGKVVALPARDDVNFPIQEQLIVELYSK